jgi:hypothetical protein
MKPLRLAYVQLALLLLLASPLSSLAASLSGTVTNKTVSKPSVGDTVVLLNLTGGMTESGRTKTDAKGEFTFNVPDAGPHLIRVEHQKGSYFKQAPPGTQSVEIDVYDVAPKVEGITTEANVIRMETDNSGLKVTENYFVKNDSSPPRTQFSDHAYEIYLPTGAKIDGSAAMAPAGMPVASSPVPLGDEGHYAFAFPIRPGETRFQVSYTVPYTGSYKFKPKLAIGSENLAVMLPKAMRFAPGGSTVFAPVNEDPTAQTFVARNIAPNQPIEFTVSGTGSMPREAQGAPTGGEAQGSGAAGGGSPDGPGETVAAPSAAGGDTRPGGGLGVPVGGEDPINKYRWWILGGLSVILAIAAGFLLRKPSSPPLPAPVPAGHFAGVPPPPPPPFHAASDAAAAPASMLAVLKDELFALETERLEGKISESEYVQLKSAFETVLRRTLARQPQ